MTSSEQQSIFHSGEQALQEKLGVKDKMAAFAQRVVRPFMPDQHRQFYQDLPFVAVGNTDEDGNVWASLWFNQGPGFIQSPDSVTLDVAPELLKDDPLNQSLKKGSKVGLLGIELSSRRRNRLSVQVAGIGEQKLKLDVIQAFGNCPQYIQTRQLEWLAEDQLGPVKVTSSSDLDNGARELITASDTFFVASSYDDGTEQQSNGADVSHRGGKPGFVRVDEDGTLTIPDFAGNNHFNTLGNLYKNPKAGLLFIDFEKGHMLSMTGSTKIHWEDPHAQHFNGALRTWQFIPEKVVWMKNVLPFRWKLNELSPNNLITGDWQQAEARAQLASQQNQWRVCEIKKVVDESEQVKSFYLAPVDGPVQDFRAGQFLTLEAIIDGQKQRRTYTLSSTSDDETYRISVKKDGLFSSYLHQHVTAGSQIQTGAPAGNFVVQSERPSVLLAAGIGITPFVSMFRQALNNMVKYRQQQPFYLFYQVRDKHNRPFFDELSRLQEASKGLLNVFWSVSRPDSTMVPGTDIHHQGRIDKTLIQSVLPLDDYDFYLCGPAGFVQSQYDNLMQLGVRDERIFTEAFGPSSLQRVKSQPSSAEASEPPAADDAIIHFEHSQVEQAWTQKDQDLLTFAESHGITPEFGCRSGQCGSCKVKVTKGKVTHQGKASYPVEQDEALLCCAVPAKTEEQISVVNIAV